MCIYIYKYDYMYIYVYIYTYIMKLEEDYRLLYIKNQQCSQGAVFTHTIWMPCRKPGRVPKCLWCLSKQYTNSALDSSQQKNRSLRPERLVVKVLHTESAPRALTKWRTAVLRSKTPLTMEPRSTDYTSVISKCILE